MALWNRSSHYVCHAQSFHTWRSFSTSLRHPQAHKGDTPRGRNILAEVENGEDDQAQGYLENQRNDMARQPIWDGEERVQDTILRMLTDKYQPLRVKGQERTPGEHPADGKMASIQKPSPTLGSVSFAPRPKDEEQHPSLEDVEKISNVDLPNTGHEDGRRLAKTPEDKPWRAVYVNPLHTSQANGDPPTLSVYYGKYIGAPVKSSGRVIPKTASGKERLKLAGIQTEALPIDDRNKMRAIRESVRKWDRAGRIRGVKEEAVQYRRSREEERERSEMSEEELIAILEAEAKSSGTLQEGEEMKLSSSTAIDAKPGETAIAMSGGRGFTSLANERIEMAMKTDYFRRNSLRGKPFEKDLHANNPFLKGEERIMNRLIQKQGAAPPWVELNGQVENHTRDFRHRLKNSWLRRASRIILATPHLRSGLEPLTELSAQSSFHTLEQNKDSFSAGQQRLFHLVAKYSDAEWESREEAYHEAAIRDVNNVIRRYNIVAPVSARRGLLTRQWELLRVRDESKTELFHILNHNLLDISPNSAPNQSTPFQRPELSNAKGDASSALSSAYAREATAFPTTRSLTGSSERQHSGEDPVSNKEQKSRNSSMLTFFAFIRRAAQRAKEFAQW